MIKHINPEELKSPSSRYSHGIEVAAGARWLHVSGQTGSGGDVRSLTNFELQVEEAFSKVEAVLTGANMSKANLVKLTAYVCLPNGEALAAYRKVRDRWLEGHTAASTYLVVVGLANPNLLVEIEAIAASDQ